ncbi:tRNA pseudouridine(55) synthase TruB [Alkalicoccus luteus]|uniref:tRNA pseudouridine synthase B n=1 Tax=Alkalicoccus luteus TaxID=1237094 RepID=A0A969TTS4_9BACI|nr:tRNA pseudouridine(55) synthase TruB [Alkalicoccus luteus]NJP36307.1 tRNA pseudouridine(55) synthase TruB [Alkalicoccus luteus]
MNEINGIVPLWKPAGMTSFEAVKRVRRIYGTKKAGHTGTLDPEVEGVLPVCLGRATKLVEYLTGVSKQYEGTVTIGYSTDTEDSHGSVINQTPAMQAPSEEEADQALAQLTGVISQQVPMYSAVKVKGKRLYEYAREGVEVERPIRNVTIHELKRTSAIEAEAATASFSFTCLCSKGTYIRTLSVDIGRKLGYAAHMSALTRTASGSIDSAQCVTFEQLEASDDPGEYLVTMEHATAHFPAITISDELELKVLQGAILPLPEQFTEDASFAALHSSDGRLLALYKRDEKREGSMKPEKMIRTADQPR